MELDEAILRNMNEPELRAVVARLQKELKAAYAEGLTVAEKYHALQGAVRRHRDQRGDDRCWMDDHELYAALPEGYEPPPLDVAICIEHCHKFLATREHPETKYVSPQRRIEQLETQLKAAMDERDRVYAALDNRNPA